MSTSYSSRERMRIAIGGGRADHVPCCFMIFAALRSRCRNTEEFIQQQLDLGLDAMVQVPARPPRSQTDHADLPGLPVRFHPDVQIREWTERPPGSRYPILHKEYITPAGTLSTEVDQTEDWPYGDSVPFLDDYLIPRAHTLPVAGPDDLKPLAYLLTPPSDDDICAFREGCAEAKRLAENKGVLVWGGWGAISDMIGWLCGLRNLPLLAVDQPSFVHELVQFVATWNRRRMEVFLDAGVDLFIRRAWYEGADFWSPRMYREFILPTLQADVRLAHERGVQFGYIMTTGTMPIVDMIMEAGVDVLIGVDPVQDTRMDMRLLRQKTRGKMALWGGANGFLTVERGTKEEIRKAAVEAVRVLGPDGFILSPVDNVRDPSDATWENVLAFIEAWKEMR